MNEQQNRNDGNPDPPNNQNGGAELEIARLMIYEALRTIGDVRPTEEQLQTLRASGERRGKQINHLHTLNIDRWLEAKVGAFICNVKNREQLRNLLKRVIALIIRIVMDDSITRIILLDGHGRTLYLLLEGLKICEDLIEPDRLAQLKQNITVVEATDDVQEFHNSCFPAEISCVQADVFDYIQGVNGGEEIDYGSTLIYLNFCGLGIPGVRDGVEQTVRRLNELLDRNPQHLMISYAMRGFYRSQSKQNITNRLNDNYGSRDELERQSHGGMKTWYTWDRYAENTIEQRINTDRMNRLKNITVDARTYYRDFVRTYDEIKNNHNVVQPGENPGIAA